MTNNTTVSDAVDKNEKTLLRKIADVVVSDPQENKDIALKQLLDKSKWKLSRKT